MNLQFSTIFFLVLACCISACLGDACDGVECAGKRNGYQHTTCLIRMLDPNNQKNLHYLVQHDIDTKLPEWTMYFQKQSQAPKNSTRSRDFREHECKAQLKGFQKGTSYYDNVPRHPIETGKYGPLALYHKGHLVPSDAFSENQALMDNTFYYTNAAPEIADMNRAWFNVEDAVKDFINENSNSDGGFIITGVYHTDSDEVPDFFWKIMCTRLESGQIAAGFFFHNNDVPSGGKDNYCPVINGYIDEMVVPRDMDLFAKKFPLVNVSDIWDKWNRFAAQYYPGAAHQKLIQECKAAQKLPTCAELNFPAPTKKTCGDTSEGTPKRKATTRKPSADCVAATTTTTKKPATTRKGRAKKNRSAGF